MLLGARGHSSLTGAECVEQEHTKMIWDHSQFSAFMQVYKEYVRGEGVKLNICLKNVGIGKLW